MMLALMPNSGDYSVHGICHLVHRSKFVVNSQLPSPWREVSDRAQCCHHFYSDYYRSASKPNGACGAWFLLRRGFNYLGVAAHAEISPGQRTKDKASKKKT